MLKIYDIAAHADTGRGIIPFLVANSDKHNNAPPHTHTSPPPSNYLLNFSMSRSASSMSLLSSSSSGLGINTSSEKQPRVYFLKTTWKKIQQNQQILFKQILFKHSHTCKTIFLFSFPCGIPASVQTAKVMLPGHSFQHLCTQPLVHTSPQAQRTRSQSTVHIFFSVIAIGRVRRGC